MPLTHTCVCFKTWILQRVVSGCLFFLLMCEGDLAPERSQKEKRFEYTQHPPAVKHLRWHFELPGGQTLPGQKDTRQNPAGLQVLTEAGVPPPPHPPTHGTEGSGWGACTVNISTNRHDVSPLTSPLHQAFLSALVRPHSSRPGLSAFLRLL